MIESPAPPETPESVKWFAWILHHFRRERDTMRRAPVFFLAIAAIGAFIGYLVAAARFEDRATTAEERVRLANDQVNSYKDKLQGASPDQAAKEVAALQDRVEALSKQMERMIVAQPERASRLIPKYAVRQTPTDQLPLEIDISVRNGGNIPGTSPLHSNMNGYFDHVLSKEELDDLFSKMLEESRPERARLGTNKVFPEDSSIYYTLVFPVVPKSIWDKVVSGEQFAYLLTILQYKDETTPAGKWRETEGCVYISKDQSMRICDFHNSDSLVD